MASRKATGSLSSGVISLKRMPGLGKSGMSRIKFARFMAISWCAVIQENLRKNGGRATMTIQVRRAVLADTDCVCEFNRLLALESEGKALDPAVLRRGVGAVLEDAARGVYFLAAEEGRILGQ